MLARRSFLSSLITAGLAAAVDPERLLWVPGRKLISIPKAPAAAGFYYVNDDTGVEYFVGRLVNQYSLSAESVAARNSKRLTMTRLPASVVRYINSPAAVFTYRRPRA